MKINIVKPILPNIDAVSPEFAKSLESGLVTNNSKHVVEFEKNLQHFLSSKLSPVCYCNGEMALFSLLQAWKNKLGYGPYDSFDVLVPSFTFSGTLNAIVMNNLKPVFCDVNETLTLDIKKIKHVDEKIKFIVAVSVYGNLPDIEEIGRFAEQHGLVFILDNAPGFGSKYNDKFPNQYGFSEIYSFHATKIYNSMEGGAAIVNDSEIHAYLQRIRDFGQFEKLRGDVDIPGLNSKMMEISAIVGKSNLNDFDNIISKRQKTIDLYKSFFNQLEHEGYLTNMQIRSNVYCVYLYYPIILYEDAADFVEFMAQNNIACRRYYTAVHDLRFYKNKFFCHARLSCDCRNYFCEEQIGLEYTNSIKDRIVSLPLHTEMSDNEINYLFEKITLYFKNEGIVSE